jgi:hypothetical protein
MIASKTFGVEIINSNHSKGVVFQMKKEIKMNTYILA